MKDSRSTNNKQSKQGMTHKAVPEIRDNIDSRHGEEQDLNGTDTTHHKKEQHSKKKSVNRSSGK
jgi:hypothetical protein